MQVCVLGSAKGPHVSKIKVDEPQLVAKGLSKMHFESALKGLESFLQLVMLAEQAKREETV